MNKGEKMNHEKKRWRFCEVAFEEDWSNIFHPKHFNWVGFHFIHLYIEYDPYGPIFQLNVFILGLGFYISINPPWETSKSKTLRKQVQDAIDHPEKLIPLDECDFRPDSGLGDIENE